MKKFIALAALVLTHNAVQAAKRKETQSAHA